VWATWEQAPGNPRCGMCDVTAFTVRAKGIGAGRLGANSGRGAPSTGVGPSGRASTATLEEAPRAGLTLTLGR